MSAPSVDVASAVFADAGQEPGTLIWAIENFEPVPIDLRKYGQFYNGDSYIVLKTTQSRGSSLSHDAHFWLGSLTSQDKRGAAAIWTIFLDDALGGGAVHHREVQGHESSLFLGYFKPAIRYLEGGSDSGFNEVQTNAGAEKRLLRLSGCDNMRVEEVAAEVSSLNKETCFILELEHDIFVLMPEGARATQRRKIISVANTLRDDYHNGRATIEIIDEFSSDEDVSRFFEALGSGSKDDIAEALDSESFARDGTTVHLLQVLLGDDLELIDLKRPYKQTQLSDSEMYILDTPDSGIFIWIGASVDDEAKRNYYDVVQKYLEAKGYPSWLHVTRVSAGRECSLFKQYFQNWDINDMEVQAYASQIDAGYASEEDSAARAVRIGKSAAASKHMPDDGTGNISLTRVSGGDSEDITESVGAGAVKFYQSEAYVIKYRYSDDNGEDAYILYYWVGVDADKNDKQAALAMVMELEDELEGYTIIVKVPQGKEPKHFLGLFKGKLVILFGGKDNGYAPDNENHNYEENRLRLFRVRGTQPGVDMSVVQLGESPDSLEDDGVFVLEAHDTVFVRVGSETDAKERDAVTEFLEAAVVMIEDREVLSFEQGDEPASFWEVLGGEVEATESRSSWKTATTLRLNASLTLTAVAVRASGRLEFEEIANYTQEDLSDDGAYIVDTCEEIYFWFGNNVPERLRARKHDAIEEYLSDDGLGRTADTAMVAVIRQDKEPAAFRALFPDWQADLWQNQSSYDDIKNAVKAGNSL